MSANILKNANEATNSTQTMKANRKLKRIYTKIANKVILDLNAKKFVAKEKQNVNKVWAKREGKRENNYKLAQKLVEHTVNA